MGRKLQFPYLNYSARCFLKIIKMENKYYYLKKGEIIQEGDEVEISSNWNDSAKWVDAKNTVGQKAPDPSFIAHRKYRRLIKL